MREMRKKLIILGLIAMFGLIFVTQHVDWIEELFQLYYPVGQAATPYLLGIIIAILALKK